VPIAALGIYFIKFNGEKSLYSMNMNADHGSLYPLIWGIVIPLVILPPILWIWSLFLFWMGRHTQTGIFGESENRAQIEMVLEREWKKAGWYPSNQFEFEQWLHNRKMHSWMTLGTVAAAVVLNDFNHHHDKVANGAKPRPSPLEGVSQMMEGQMRAKP